MEKKQFKNVVEPIKESRNKTVKVENSELINLYWNILKYKVSQVSHPIL